MSVPLRAKTLNRRTFLSIGLASAGLAALPLLQACGPAAAPTPTPQPAKPAEAPKPTTAPAAAATATPAAKPTEAVAKPTEAAAAKPAAPTPGAKPAAVKPGTKIVVTTRIGSDAEIMVKSVADFTKETGIPAESVVYGPEAEYWPKVQTMHATKQVADVIWASVGNFHNFANRGILAELEPLIKADNYDLSDYLPNGLKTMSWKGKLYGMPWGGHPGNGGLLYNVDLLNKAGVSVTEDPESLDSWTYDTLKDAAVRATVQSGGKTTQFGYMPGTDYLSLNNVVGAHGGELYSADGTKLTMDTDAVKKGLGWVRDIFVTLKAAPTPGPDVNSSELFATGRLAMVLTGYWGQFDPGEKSIAGKFKWNVALQPKGPAGKRGTQLTINGQTISSISENKEAAWQFVKWLMDPKNHIPIVLAGGSRPALRKSVLENPELMTKMKAHKVFAKGLMEAEPWRMPANLRWPEFNTTLTQVFAGVWTGNQTLEQAYPEAIKKLQDIMDKPMI